VVCSRLEITMNELRATRLAAAVALVVALAPAALAEGPADKKPSARPAAASTAARPGAAPTASAGSTVAVKPGTTAAPEPKPCEPVKPCSID